MHRVSQMLSHISDMKNYRSTVLILLGITILAQTSSLFAVSINHSKMRRDLDIAEEALKQILQYREDPQKELSWLETDQIQSAYIDGHGVIFLVTSSLERRNFEIGSQVKVIMEKDGTGNVTRKLPDSAIPFSKALKQKRLAEFLERYGPTISQLKGNEQISILLDTQAQRASLTMKVKNFISKNLPHNQTQNLDTPSAQTGELHNKTVKVSVFRSQDEKSKKIPGVRIRMVTPDSIASIDTLSHQMVKNMVTDMKHPPSTTFSKREIVHASLQKSNLDAFRKQSFSVEKLTEQIKFQTFSSDSTLIKKIDILSGIFDTALGLNTRSPLETRNQALGAYIPNLGAFFFLKNNQQAMMHTGDPITLKNTLIETLADYGSTLRDVKPNEEVIIHVHADYPQYAFHRASVRVIKPGIYQTTDLTKSTPNEFPENLILRVKKKHLNDYNAGKIDLKKLREKITITDH